MSDPIDHHYVPRFYLSRWAGEDGLLVRYSKPYGDKFVSDRVSPRGTAFERHLYDFVPKSQSALPSIESSLLAHVDDAASKVLELIENGVRIEGLNESLRRDWARFLTAQQLRSPEDIEQLMSNVFELWTAGEADLQAKYELRRQPNDPPRVEELLTSHFPYHREELAQQVAFDILCHKGFVQIYESMRWAVLAVPDDCYPLITSDRPIWSTATMMERDDFLTFPIGPRRLFVAAVSDQAILRLTHQPRRKVVMTTNKFTSQHASKFVFADGTQMAGFVARHFSTKRHSTLLERLAVLKGLKVVSVRSPSAIFNRK